ncbi:hypothetical protein Ae168Ps1_2129 [Pseudonocardia sp. Ae168_Ps1]|nr:hypothetical protein Ae150APs1_2123 [Pseudonocardia sp. Ae150A_Ps1]OLL79723.1 hypothetical protein Ae168Ps1_2129 [Pseudonocardia sp. Ae168_Ps1]OLL86141.1 hypothetical protein Ae263Ps1_3196c [Pseudonocardia sp. Ae263_Ps1]OLL93828.1 hypothetical protein Ae356Ps1_3725 [Pseudonocardia sp. Ae356_Ps1]
MEAAPPPTVGLTVARDRLVCFGGGERTVDDSPRSPTVPGSRSATTPPVSDGRTLLELGPA